MPLNRGEDSWFPWTARRSKQSILKEIYTKYSLKGLMLELKFQYFSHLIWRADSLKRPWCWERLKTRGEEDDRGWDGWVASPTQWTWVWVNSGSWWWIGRAGVLRSMGSQRVRHNWATGLNWTTNNACRHKFANKGPSSQSYGFSSSHTQMWKLEHKEG